MSRVKSHTKFIFVTGGVVSSLGKGIVAASAGALLESRGLKVTITKADPYLNVDPGTMSPFQHGEVFVTDDGAETDLDIGHYERFTSNRLTKENSFSTGQVYDTVLGKERRGVYLGGTVQVVPHITNQIKENIFKASEGADISIVEIGGTVGDIESLPFLETIRQIRYELGADNVICVHLTLVPYIAAAKELKTKPTQHSVRDLRQVGIQPDVLVCRADREIPQDLKEKVALFCNVPSPSVFECIDSDSIYKIPMYLHQQGFDQNLVDLLQIWTRNPDLSHWRQIERRLSSPKHTVRVGLVGKYVDVVDSYKSIMESLVHAGIANDAKIDIVYLDSETVGQSDVFSDIESCDAIIVPGGFGGRGIEGKIEAIRHIREKKIPFLGICLGMQLAAIEYGRHVIGIDRATSEEFDDASEHQIIHLMAEQKEVQKLGGTMRLGAYPCVLAEGSRAAESYGQTQISERHRHRFEFNNNYREIFMDHGVIFSGLSPDGLLVEMLEIKDHPFFVGCQFHPELKSRPFESHPLFRELIKVAIRISSSRNA